MGIRLREADLLADGAALTELARANLGQTDAQRFRWLYRDNPFGPARAWIAFNGTEAPIGMCALFPRRAYVAGAEVLGCVLGDFCVSEGYRTLGPAIQLQRACLSSIEAGQFAFGYDFPSRSMLGVYRFLGIAPGQSSVRMAKLLRSEDKIRAVTRVQTLSQLISKPVDLALKAKDHRASSPEGLECRIEDEPCLSAYAQLAGRIGSSLGSCTVRNAEYLNWRYRQHPFVKYEFFAGYRGDNLLGYCIFCLAEGRAEIVDVFGSMDEPDLTAMLSSLVSVLRSRKVSVVSMEILDNDPRIATFDSLGFRNRGMGPVINCLGASSTQLLLMHGDRES
jgi:hypothetical protein